MKSILALLLFSATSLALAHSCPKEMKAIDAKLESVQGLGAEQMNKVKTLRAEGERLHKEGKHDASMNALNEAKNMLGI